MREISLMSREADGLGGKGRKEERQLGEREGLAISPSSQAQPMGNLREEAPVGSLGKWYGGGAWWRWVTGSIGLPVKAHRGRI